MTAKSRGGTLLKVVGIILIVFGAISLVGALITLATGSLTSSVLGLDASLRHIMTLSGIVALVSGAILLVCGILGVKWRNALGKENALLAVGIFLMIVTVFESLFSAKLEAMLAVPMAAPTEAYADLYDMSSYNSFAGTLSMVFTVISFALPALFIVGALLNRLAPKPDPAIGAQSGGNPLPPGDPQ